MRDLGGLFAAAANVTAVSATLIAAAEPHEDERDQAIAVAKLVEYSVKSTAAAAQDKEYDEYPKATVVVAAEAKTVCHNVPPSIFCGVRRGKKPAAVAGYVRILLPVQPLLFYCTRMRAELLPKK